MWLEYFRFELKYRRSQALFWITGLLLFAAGVALVSSDFGVTVAEGNNAMNRNAPMVLIYGQIVLSLLGMFVLTAFVSDSVLRDFRRNTTMFFFSKPARERDYLIGRFTGSMFIALLLFLAPLAGFVVGCYVPWQEAHRLGPVALGPMFYGYAVFVVPNLLALGAIFFAVSVLTRRILVIYLITVFVMLLQDGMEVLAVSLNNRFLGGVLEPAGLVAVSDITRYWTVSEFNSLVPTMSPALLFNRLLWLGFAGLMLGLALKRFKTAAPAARTRKKRGKTSVAAKPVAARPKVRLCFSPWGTLQRLFWQVRLESAIVFKSVPFIVMLLLGIVITLITAHLGGVYRGVPFLPITSRMLMVITKVTQTYLPILIMIYSAELVWRAPRTATIEDVLPLPNLVFLTSKVLTIFTVILTTLACTAGATVLFQLASGYTILEPLLYAKGMFIVGFPLFLIGVAAVFLHTVAGSKNMGHLFVLGLLLMGFVLPKVGLDNGLYQYAKMPPMVHSVFNGYGHFVEPFVFYCIYWGLAALCLFVLTGLLWSRGPRQSWPIRTALARKRVRGFQAFALPLVLIGFAATGWYIRQNSVGDQTERQVIARQAAYERNYAGYKDAAIPRIKAVKVAVDLFPHERRAAVKGRYELFNDSGRTIDSLPVTLTPRFEDVFDLMEGGVELVSLGTQKPTLADQELGFYLFPLEQPLAPGERTTLEFELKVDQSAWRNRVVNHQITADLTHLSESGFLPALGYNTGGEIAAPNTRKAHGLGEGRPYPRIHDAGALDDNYLMADWIDYEATISTVADQIVVGQGDLVAQWEENGRAYFRYKTRAPITKLLTMISGRFQVRREVFQGIDIEIYHHGKHGYNIDRMMEVAKATLDYGITQFGPYPHKQLRIVEVPNYDPGLAVSLGTLITISEDFGFTAEQGSIDLSSYVTAHEVAHQWWNHQVIGAHTQGATMIAESLSQYTALAVLEQLFDEEAVNAFLLEDLDSYFKASKKMSRPDKPLVLVENQGYIHYNKGILAFHTIRDILGETQLNEVLSGFLMDNRFQGPPYPTATQLVARLRAVMPAEHQGLLEDLFETVTLHDHRLVQVRCRPMEDGKFQVDLTVNTKKLRLDDLGESHEVTTDGVIEIGFYTAESGLPFIVTSHRITGEEMNLSLMLDKAPERVGLDPGIKTMDRDREDNMKMIEKNEEVN